MALLSKLKMKRITVLLAAVLFMTACEKNIDEAETESTAMTATNTGIRNFSDERQ